MALAVWDSTATSWAKAATAGANGGVLAFVNPTVAPAASGQPPAIPAAMSGWTSGDLVMTAITSTPEPGTLALAGLGLASLLALRRRK